jgi:serine/threonine-protein kinase
LLAGRYRIVAMLGKGGMGEVYRADDLTLDQPVALKFLPESLTDNPNAVERFRNEVRIARQVSHGNVCRVYDLGEIEGLYFLSMEYVDGEDLGSLLRRIGRLPVDKALEIARKLCAGLAAAHEKGVLHRDLKPSNIMLDSRGHVLLTDFGLAGLAGQIEGAEVRNGTPAYMAPEQLAGQEVTIRSDIYSLGLVLYEIFTGKLPFESNTLAGLIHARTTSAPESPSTLVKDLDPMIERVILRCLEVKPERRPASALAVAAGLPGGNPLAEALAAGETPSPEMVAAAGEGEGLEPKYAVALFVLVLVAMVVAMAMGARLSALEFAPPELTPEILAHKAREIVQKMGGNGHPVDSAYGIFWQHDYINYLATTEKHPDWRRAAPRPPMMLNFWYRQGESPLTPLSFHDDLLTPALEAEDDPPFTESGMARVTLDATGRLLYFETIPLQDLGDPPKQTPAVDWSPLFSAAGLDVTQLTPTESHTTFLAASDTRLAWSGTWPNSKYWMRVEAAALRGKPVAFALVGQWTGLDREPPDTTGSDLISFVFQAGLVIVLVGGSALLAVANLKRNRGDKRGAFRLAIFTFLAQIAIWFSKGHFALSQGLFAMAIFAVATAIFAAAVIWGAYIAIEPYMRRRYPETLIGWSAVLTGRLNDPVVGRDLLFGIAGGVGILALWRVWTVLHSSVYSKPELYDLDPLMGMRSVLGLCLAFFVRATRNALLIMLLIFLLRVLRRQWVAAVVLAAIVAAVAVVSNDLGWADATALFVALAASSVTLARWGLLASASFLFALMLLSSAMPAGDPRIWYFQYSFLILAVLAGLAFWAMRTATAGRRLWSAKLLD